MRNNLPELLFLQREMRGRTKDDKRGLESEPTAAKIIKLAQRRQLSWL